MAHGKPSSVSTVFVVLLGVMSAAVLLTIYHCIVGTWCNQQQRRQQRHARGEAAAAAAAAAAGGSAELSSVLLIPPAVKYDKAAEGMVGADQTTCAVCLSDFEDGEAVRLLPECLHCFHMECIDMWLNSHTNCPMCRTQMLGSAQDTPDLILEGRRATSSANMLLSIAFTTSA